MRAPLRCLCVLLTTFAAAPPAAAQTFIGLDPPSRTKKPTELLVALDKPVPGARLFIDGVLAGALPMEPKAVSPGRHTVRVERPGYRAVETTVAAARGARNRVSLVLEPEGTLVSIGSAEPGAECSIDGAPAEPLPLVRVVTPGRHGVLVTKDGFEPEVLELQAELGVDATLTAELRPAMASDRPIQGALAPAEEVVDADLGLEHERDRLRAAPRAEPSRWYIWTGIGVVAAGAVTAAILASQPRPHPIAPIDVCRGPCDATVGVP
ncbi:MAG: PEGA domain-containing protein [Myxococcaceae bacterium]